MSSPNEPPDIDEVVVRVNEALDELDVVAGPERDALLSSLRAALGALGDIELDSVEVRAVPVEVPVEVPSVEVVTGGRGDDPRSEGPRPALRVARPVVEEGEPVPTAERPPRRRAVQVVSVAPEELPEAPVASGRFALAAGEWQTVFHGAGPRCYRLGCRAGRVGIYAEGEPSCELRAGQTVDIEASLIRLNAEGVGKGWYTWLDG